MKTTFYKKLVPLAMIASLALSGAGSAMAGTGFLTYNGNSIVAFAADETEAPKSTAAVDLNFDLMTANVAAAAKFDYFDADNNKTRTIKVDYDLQENYIKNVQNCTETAVTVYKDSDNTEKVGRAYVKEYIGGIWIINVGTNENYICHKEGDVWFADDSTMLSDADVASYNPSLTKEEADVRPITDAVLSKINLDDFAFTLNERYGTPEEVTEDGKTVTTYPYNELIEGMKVTGIELKKPAASTEGEAAAQADEDTTQSNTYTLTIEVPASVASNSSIYLVYGGLLTGTVGSGTLEYKKTTGDGVVTTYTNNAITKYEGDAKEIDLNRVAGITSIGAEAFKGTGIKNVIVSDGITSIGAGAFSECESLETVTIPADSELTYVAPDAFPDNTVVILNKDENGNVSSTAKTALEGLKVNVFDESDVKEGSMLVSAGDTIVLNCTKNAIVSGSNSSQFKFGTYSYKATDNATEDSTGYYTFDEVDKDDKSKEQITDYKWVLVTSAYKPSTAARINTKLGQLADATNFVINKTKANGKFNNTVKLIAVPKSTTKEYDKATIYAECDLYIKPALVTEWSASSKGTFVAIDVDDTDKPIQNDAKQWIHKPVASTDDADGINVNAKDQPILVWTSWEDVVAKAKAGTWKTTTNSADAWTLDDGTPVVVPAVDEDGNVKFNSKKSETEFDLTITEGQSFSLPIKAKNGADKTLNYKVTKGYSNFTVVNGKVKGISEGEGTIVVSPVAEHTVDDIIVNVKVTPKVSKGVTNTTSLTLVGEKPQSFRIGANPVSSKDLYYTITEDENLTITNQNVTEINEDGEEVSADVTIGSSESAVTYHKLIDGADVITVAQKAGKSIGTAKKSLDIQYYEIKTDDKGVKTASPIGKKFTVKVNESKTGEYDNVKKFKESAGKLDKVTKYRKLSVPVGVTTYLGLSVTPATANQNFTVKFGEDSDRDCVIAGDAITPLAEGYYEFYAESDGIGADGKTVESTKYIVEAYEQGGSIEFDDGESDDEFTVVGGYLIRNGAAKADSNHTFAPGETLAFAEPTITTDGECGEGITWTSNNPAGLAVWFEDGMMNVKGLQPGTYTVTGKSARTAQKYTFKVIIDKKYNKAENDSREPAVGILNKWDGINTTPLASDETYEKGDTLQLALDVPTGVAGTVKWTTEDKTKATVSGKGLVKIVNKANASGTCKITATMTLNDKDGKKVKGANPITKEFTINLAASTVSITTKNVPAAAKAGTAFKVSGSLKNAAKGSVITWKSTPVTANTAETSGTNLTLDKGKVTIATEGTYKIWATYGTGANYVEEDAGTIVVSKVTPSKLAVVDGSVGEKMSVKDLKNSKVGLQNYAKSDVKDPVRSANVVVKAITDKTDAPADLDDMIWTSSNANAVVATSAKGTDNAQYATVKVEVVNGTKYTGKVTLTGVSKNGGKKVSFVVYVNDEATGTALGVTSATTKATTAADDTTTTTTTVKS